MTECSRFEEDICALVDGELDDAGATELAAHLAVCPRCLELQAQMKSLKQSIAALPEPVLSERQIREMQSAVTAIAADPGTAHETPEATSRSRRRFGVLVQVAAATLIAAASFAFGIQFAALRGSLPTIGVPLGSSSPQGTAGDYGVARAPTAGGETQESGTERGAKSSATGSSSLAIPTPPGQKSRLGQLSGNDLIPEGERVPFGTDAPVIIQPAFKSRTSAGELFWFRVNGVKKSTLIAVDLDGNVVSQTPVAP